MQTADWREFLHLHLLLMNVLFSSFHLDCRGTLTNFLSGLQTDFIAPECRLTFLFTKWAYFFLFLFLVLRNFRIFVGHLRAEFALVNLFTILFAIHLSTIRLIKICSWLFLTVDISNLMLFILVDRFLLFVMLLA